MGARHILLEILVCITKLLFKKALSKLSVRFLKYFTESDFSQPASRNFLSNELVSVLPIKSDKKSPDFDENGQTYIP